MKFSLKEDLLKKSLMANIIFGGSVYFECPVNFETNEATVATVLQKHLYLKISQYSQVFSCESAEIFKSIYFERHLQPAIR